MTTPDRNNPLYTYDKLDTYGAMIERLQEDQLLAFSELTEASATLSDEEIALDPRSIYIQWFRMIMEDNPRELPDLLDIYIAAQQSQYNHLS